jgi:trehalose/maltose hydrolase-like predicted phosphorylase
MSTASRATGGQEATAELTAGQPLLIEKLVALYSSGEPAIAEAGLEARQKIGDLGRFDTLLDEHRRAWKHVWVGVRNRDRHLRRCRRGRGASPTYLPPVADRSLPHDRSRRRRAAAWLAWEAYRGHIFWDELFIFPFLNLRIPAITRALLRYRYRRLPEARSAARAARYRGAMFPWQSGSNGREESQIIHLNPVSGRWMPDNSHRQRHINAAIAYNVWQYYQISEDQGFLDTYASWTPMVPSCFWPRS